MKAAVSQYRKRGKPERAMAEIRRMLLRKISERIKQERAAGNIPEHGLLDHAVPNSEPTRHGIPGVTCQISPVRKPYATPDNPEKPSIHT
jgi:hypothetical protein